MESTLDLGFAPHINAMMGGWRDIVQDTRRLTRIVTQLPDQCDCPTEGGQCECCQTLERPFPGQCGICAEHLADLSARITGVLDDTLRYLPALEATRVGSSVPLHDLLRDVAIATVQVLRVLDELKAATGDFQHGCRTTHIARIKRACERLTAAVERAHARLRSI